MNQRNGEPKQLEGVGRRAVLEAGLGSGLSAATLPALPGSAEAQTPTTPPPTASPAPFPASRNGPLDRPYNVILFITDEEAYHLRPAEGFATPARAELRRRGTTFLNHYIGSTAASCLRHCASADGAGPDVIATLCCMRGVREMSRVWLHVHDGLAAESA
jgi:hypothetical protein